MIELILAVKILLINSRNTLDYICNSQGTLGCYSEMTIITQEGKEETNRYIFLDYTQKDVPLDYVFYHEMGHLLIRDKSEKKEDVSDHFADWIYSKRGIKINVSDEDKQRFEKACNDECFKAIINIDYLKALNPFNKLN